MAAFKRLLIATPSHNALARAAALFYLTEIKARA